MSSSQLFAGIVVLAVLGLTVAGGLIAGGIWLVWRLVT